MVAIAPQHLSRIDDPQQAQALFKMAVVRVIVETSSYCNRRCGYCPNAFIDRISSKNHMPEPVFAKLLTGLAEIEYKGAIVLHFYNEPLADPTICEKISRASKACPNANISIYSNGDYLDRDYLERLRAAGLTSMVLALHLGNDAQWSDEAIISRLTELAVRIGKTVRVLKFVPGSEIAAKIPDDDIDIMVHHRDYYESGADRGGLMANIAKQAVPNTPCLSPFTELNVAWDGTIVPCCHVHADAPAHQDYVIGKLDDYPSIFLAYANSALAEWRRSMASPAARQAPCDTCAVGLSDPADIAFLRDLYARVA
jgi:hypothetical protein